MMLDETYRAREIASQYGCQYFDMENFRVPEELIGKISAELIFRYNFVPLEEMQDGKLAIAIADPSQLLMIDEIGMQLKKQIDVRVSTLKQIARTLKKIERSQCAKQN